MPADKLGVAMPPLFPGGYFNLYFILFCFNLLISYLWNLDLCRKALNIKNSLMPHFVVDVAVMEDSIVVFFMCSGKGFDVVRGATWSRALEMGGSGFDFIFLPKRVQVKAMTYVV